MQFKLQVSRLIFLTLPVKQTEIELYYIEMYFLCLLCEPYIFVLALFTKVGWPYSKLNSL